MSTANARRPLIGVAAACAPAIVAAAIAVASAAVGSAEPAPAPPPGTKGVGGVERQRPKNLTLQISGNPALSALLYGPPAGGAAGAGGAGAGGAAPAPGPLPVLFFSGEIGWRPLQQDTASFLALRGRHVLAIDSVAYFQKVLEPADLARDLATFRATLNDAAGRPKEARVLIAGFSYGAGMVPWVINRAGTKGLQGALLVAPPKEGATVCRAAVALRMQAPENERVDVGDEIRRLPRVAVAVLEGGSDDRSHGKTLLPLVPGPRTYVEVPGADHQFHGQEGIYMNFVGSLVNWIEDQASAPESRPPGMQTPLPRADRPRPMPVGPAVGGVSPGPTPSPAP